MRFFHWEQSSVGLTRGCNMGEQQLERAECVKLLVYLTLK